MNDEERRSKDRGEEGRVGVVLDFVLHMQVLNSIAGLQLTPEH